MVKTTDSSGRKSRMLSIRESIRTDVERLVKIDKRLDADGLPYTVDDVIDEFRRHESEYTLCNFMESQIVKLKQNGKTRTSETYTAALNSFRKFLCEAKRQGRLRTDKDLMLDLSLIHI